MFLDDDEIDQVESDSDMGELASDVAMDLSDQDEGESEQEEVEVDIAKELLLDYDEENKGDMSKEFGMV